MKTRFFASIKQPHSNMHKMFAVYHDKRRLDSLKRLFEGRLTISFYELEADVTPCLRFTPP
jgi:hypothetical protein